MKYQHDTLMIASPFIGVRNLRIPFVSNPLRAIQRRRGRSRPRRPKSNESTSKLTDAHPVPRQSARCVLSQRYKRGPKPPPVEFERHTPFPFRTSSNDAAEDTDVLVTDGELERSRPIGRIYVEPHRRTPVPVITVHSAQLQTRARRSQSVERAA